MTPSQEVGAQRSRFYDMLTGPTMFTAPQFTVRYDDLMPQRQR